MIGLSSRALAEKHFGTLDDSLINKLENLFKILGEFKSVAIAFSGGVDSAFLAYVASKAVPDVLLITAISESYPEFERTDSKTLAAVLQLKQIVISTSELSNPEYNSNPPNRCYYCKKELFKSVLEVATSEKCEAVFEGGNYDDLSDYRPGRKALQELVVRSPLCEAKLTKSEIRKASAAVMLPTATKPSYACLASRFPYGETLTASKLKRVEIAEDAMRGLGFSQFRVRSHGDLARIELIESELDLGWNQKEKISVLCKNAGFKYVSLDLQGYRTGAMNETL